MISVLVLSGMCLDPMFFFGGGDICHITNPSPTMDLLPSKACNQ